MPTIIIMIYISGESRSSLHFHFRVGRSTVSKIISETCKAINVVLRPYMVAPNSCEQWCDIAKEFYLQWNYPLCIGALDGKHVLIEAPSKSGSHFYNYKGTHSVVLLALVDANMNFLYVDVGTNGRVSDGGVYKKSMLKKAIDNNTLDIPLTAKLPHTNQSLPFHIISDGAFPLTSRIMKPFPYRNLPQAKRIYNYRFSRARRIVENAFGVLASRFAIYAKPIKTSVSNIKDIIMATCSLHNLLKRQNPRSYTPPGFTDNENLIETTVRLGDWRKEAPEMMPLAPTNQRPSAKAIKIREDLCSYFSGVGAVPWQEKMINR